jgi:hypothetical protein
VQERSTDAQYAQANFGTDRSLRVGRDVPLNDGNGTTDTYETFVKFDVSALTSVGSAVVQMSGGAIDQGAISNEVSIFGVPDNSWIEGAGLHPTATSPALNLDDNPAGEITWNRRPSTNGGAIDTETVDAPGDFPTGYEWDVTGYLQAQRMAGATVVGFAFRTTGGAGAAAFAATETGPGAGPLLIVEDDVTAPTATLAAGNITTAGGTTQTVTVTYADAAGVDPATIGNDDITVTGPGGTLTVTGVTFNADNPRSVVATYTVAARGGSWDGPDNGTYNIAVAAGAVKDFGGNGAAGTGSFQVAVPVDTTPPVAASFNAQPITSAGGSTYTFTVTYTDNVAVAAGTIGAADVTVARAGGPALTVTNATTSGSGGTVNATYTVAAPGGSWDATENGTYAITVLAGSVEDAAGNDVAQKAGSFQVNIPDLSTPTATVAPIAAVTTAGTTATQVTVTYADNQAINAATIDSTDLTVVQDGGGPLAVTLVSKSPATNAASVVAVYSVVAPGGFWNSADNGTYTVTVTPGAVEDTSDNDTPLAQAQFEVNVVSTNAVADPTFNGGSPVSTGFVAEAVTTDAAGRILVAGRQGDRAGRHQPVGPPAAEPRRQPRHVLGRGRAGDRRRRGQRRVLRRRRRRQAAGGRRRVPGRRAGGRPVRQPRAGRPPVRRARRAAGGLGRDRRHRVRRRRPAGRPDRDRRVEQREPGVRPGRRPRAGRAVVRHERDHPAQAERADRRGRRAERAAGRNDLRGRHGRDVGRARAAGGRRHAGRRVRHRRRADPRPGSAPGRTSAGRTTRSAWPSGRDGRMLVGNRTAGGDFGVRRLNADGTADPTFGSGGLATVDMGGDDDLDLVALQGTGQVLLAGTTDAGAAGGTRRLASSVLLADGALEPTFGAGGKFTADAGLVADAGTTGPLALHAAGAAQADGRLLVTASDALAKPTSSPVRRLIAPGSGVIGSFGAVNGKTVGLTFQAADGKRIGLSLKGGGTGEALWDGSALDLVLTGTTDRSSLGISAKGGDRRVTLRNVQADGPMRAVSGKTTDVVGTMFINGGAGKLSLGTLTGTLAAAGSIASLATAGNVSGGFVLAGAALGTDVRVGGTGGAADAYAAARIGKLSVGGSMSGATVRGRGRPGERPVRRRRRPGRRRPGQLDRGGVGQGRGWTRTPCSPPARSPVGQAPAEGDPGPRPALPGAAGVRERGASMGCARASGTAVHHGPPRRGVTRPDPDTRVGRGFVGSRAHPAVSCEPRPPCSGGWGEPPQGAAR